MGHFLPGRALILSHMAFSARNGEKNPGDLAPSRQATAPPDRRAPRYSPVAVDSRTMSSVSSTIERDPSSLPSSMSSRIRHAE